MDKKPFNCVGVLMGGPSAEREVSLVSGKAVAHGLRTAGYEVVDVDVVKPRLDLPPAVEAVFIALHGSFGEDGTVQALLEEKGVPYTGPGPEASRKAFDKRISKRIFDEKGIPTADYEVIRNPEDRRLPLPVVVKPPLQGSSIGIELVFKEAEWPAAFQKAVVHDGEVLVERYIEGKELTAGVLGGQTLPIIEICAPQGNYDYRAKYTKGATEYRVPAPIPNDTTRAVQDVALKVFEALGCRGLGRVDFRLSPDGTFKVLELNTIPGFTETSLFPKAARHAGIDFPALCDRILRMAVLT